MALPLLAPLLGAGLKAGLGMSALSAGVLTGLGTAIVTKDINKGLTAGLGAFGGANLTGSLGAAGQASTAADAVRTVGSNIPPGMTSAQLTGDALATQAGTQFANLPTAGARLGSVGEGLRALGASGPTGTQALQAAGGGGSLAMSGLTALTPTLDASMQYDMQMGSPSMIRPSEFDPSTGRFTRLPPYMARRGGRIPGLESQVRMKRNRFNIGGNVQVPATGMLDGRGDGMSDSIKANIDGKIEARLSDGEFVIPADVVSGLGNGSSDAGADKLYGMMNKVRKERTGTTKQAPQVNPAALMPA